MAFRAILLLAAASTLGCDGSTPDADPAVPVHVGVVALDEHNLPVVILEEDHGSRFLPIWIGNSEAR
jgi:hypothetical protein